MADAWERLRPRLRELADLESALALVQWDQKVNMPARGARPRARAIATLAALIHDRTTAKEIGGLLDELEADDSLDRTRRASVRVLRRDHEQATRVPRALVEELGEQEGIAYQAWAEARERSDFSILEPELTKLWDLKKKEADALGWEGERLDALLDLHEPDVTAAEIEALFAELVAGLRPIVDAVLAAAGDPPSFLTRESDPAKQLRFCEWLVARLGFDAKGGRLDSSPHPFTIHIAPGDVRQTTRARKDALLPSIFAAFHETGHALYDQGLPEELAGLPAGRVASIGMHESQSLTWENHVGRSRAFADFLLPHLKQAFEEEVGNLSRDEFYVGINYPRRSLIRVEADELTYNLHIVVRFELELAMFRDLIKVEDLPGEWNEAMERHVGIRPDDDRDGVLQDMHWPTGAHGYFPTYSLGALYAAAFFEKATEDLGSLHEELAQGETSRLLGWLRENIHRHAYIYPAKELGERVLGEPLTPRPLLDHLKRKYGELYSIAL